MVTDDGETDVEYNNSEANVVIVDFDTVMDEREIECLLGEIRCAFDSVLPDAVQEIVDRLEKELEEIMDESFDDDYDFEDVDDEDDDEVEDTQITE
jgi:hypothetical protein